MTSTRRNGCWNLPRPTADTSYVAQAGWQDRHSWELNRPKREPVYVKVRHAMTTDCQYTKTTPDKACEGCCHQVLKT